MASGGAAPADTGSERKTSRAQHDDTGTDAQLVDGSFRRVDYPEGEYEGEIVDGVRCGCGVFRFLTGKYRGDVYDGSWEDDRPHGRGTYRWRNGATYAGEWQRGLFHGQGLYHPHTANSEEFYEGGWLEGKMHGFGKHHLPDHSVYTGMFLCGERHGRGTLEQKGGRTYVGEWVHGLRHGSGVQTYRRGARYAGDFYEGRRHGTGVLEEGDGARYEGDFVHDRKHGQGIIYFPSGARYMGSLEDGRKHGRGVFVRSTGEKSEDLYDQDEEKESHVYRKDTSAAIEYGALREAELALEAAQRARLFAEHAPTRARRHYRDGHYEGDISADGKRNGRGALFHHGRQTASGSSADGFATPIVTETIVTDASGRDASLTSVVDRSDAYHSTTAMTSAAFHQMSLQHATRRYQTVSSPASRRQGPGGAPFSSTTGTAAPATDGVYMPPNRLESSGQGSGSGGSGGGTERSASGGASRGRSLFNPLISRPTVRPHEHIWQYAGDFSMDLRHGHGVVHFSGKETYAGQFYADSADGYGVYTFADGDTYAGMFKHGHFHGHGIVLVRERALFTTWYRDELRSVRSADGSRGATEAIHARRAADFAGISSEHARRIAATAAEIPGRFDETDPCYASIGDDADDTGPPTAQGQSAAARSEARVAIKASPDKGRAENTSPSALQAPAAGEEAAAVPRPPSPNSAKAEAAGDAEGADEVRTFLDQVGLAEYYDLFYEEGFDDLESVAALTAEDLEIMRVKRGHQKKILSAVERLARARKAALASRADAAFAGSIRSTVAPVAHEGEDVLERLKHIGTELRVINYDEIAIVRRLGGGAEAMVSLGTWHGLNVAVKEYYGVGNAAVREFLKEAEILCRLHHPNIVALLAAVVQPPCVVMEYMENGSLHNVLTRLACKTPPERLPVFRAVIAALDIARGMQYLHAAGLLHRDLKSLNCLVDNNLRVRIADFGLARNQASHMTSEVGTYRWMAPEVLEGETYSSKSDVFGFGMVLYELVSSRVPFFDLTSDVRVVDAVRNGDRPEIPEGTNVDLASLIRRCWTPNPDPRPAFDEIVGILEDLGVRIHEERIQAGEVVDPFQELHTQSSSDPPPATT